jgi:hypothetical protein
MRTDLLSLTGLAALAALALAPAAGAAQDQAFQWRGNLRDGQTVEIRGVLGGIEALASPDASVRVEATRRGNRSDPASVRIEVVQHAGGVTICALYPTPPGARQPNECQPGGGRNSVRDNDVQVNFVVRVPTGVHFAGHTVNGPIKATGLAGDAQATTVNGTVEIETAGAARATSVNGGITGKLTRSQLERDAHFETVNGNIILELPAGFGAEFSGSTVSGSIDSDFPIVMTGQVSRRSLRGTIGNGGGELRVSTVNGNVRLREL